MKRKFFRFLGVGLALALLFSLIPIAGLVGAQSNHLGIQLGTKNDVDAKAEWSITEVDNGNYAVHLDSGPMEPNDPPAWPGQTTDGDEGRIVIDASAVGIETLADIESIAWSVYAVAGYPPHVDIYLDVDEDGVVDDEDVLTVELHGTNNADPVFEFMDMIALVNHGTWLETFELSSGDGFGAVDDTFEVWLSKLGGGPGDAPSGTLAQWKAGVVGADPQGEITPGVIDGTAPVLRLEIEVDNWMIDSEAYVGDITINGETYELEAPELPLDDNYYAVGESAIVTIYNGAANLDPMAIDIIDIDGEGPDRLVQVTSTTDAIGDWLTLTETGANTGKFRGTFTLLGAAPADRDLDQIVVSEADTIYLTYDDAGVGIEATARVDETPPTITGLSPVAGTIVYNLTPVIGATLTDVTSDINEATIVMTVNEVSVSPGFDAGAITYTPASLPVGSTVEVTLGVADNAGNSATTSWSFSIAAKFNESLTSATTIPAAEESDVVVEFKDAENAGIQTGTTDANKLKSVQVTLSGAGVDEDSDVLVTLNQSEYTFSNVKPEQAGEIIVTFVATFGDDSVQTETLPIDVTGYLVAETWADVGMDTTVAISLTVTTEAGTAVNTGIVTITSEGIFEKDLAGDEELESFGNIVINGTTGKITYGGAHPEDFLVVDGYYEVTGITFSNIGTVTVAVADAGGNPKSYFDIAFTVLGTADYTFEFDPATLTAGVVLDELAITVKDAGDPVTDVKWITIGTGTAEDVSIQAPEDGVYTAHPDLVKVVETLSVMAENEAGSKYGTTTLEVELPTVISDTELMLTGVEYTVSVNVTDAMGEPLDGHIWLGTYTTELTAGLGALTITPLVADVGTLVWKVGSGSDEANAALVPTPVVTVEVLEYGLDWIPVAPEVGEDITFYVTNNYGDAAGNIDGKVVSPSGDLTEKVTTPEGIFKYTADVAGDYYVSVKLGETWQDPDTVTVVVTRLDSITTWTSTALYVGETEDLIITACYEDLTMDIVTADATYVSDEPSVATVSDAGLITAVSEGTAVISVSYTEGVITKTTDVLVTVSEVPVLESIAASPAGPISLNAGETEQLTITATYSDGPANVTVDATYESDNDSVATVSLGGLIAAVAAGEALITVTYTDEITVTTDVSVVVSEVVPVTWSCPLDHLALIAPYPAMARPFLTTAADLSAVTCGADWFQVLWLDETTGEWKQFYSGFAENTLLTLEPGQYYYVIVPAPCDLTIPQ